MTHSSHQVKVLFLCMCVLRWYRIEFSQREIVMIRSYSIILRKRRKPEKWKVGAGHEGLSTGTKRHVSSPPCWALLCVCGGSHPPPARHPVTRLCKGEIISGSSGWYLMYLNPDVPARLSLAQAGLGAPPGLLPAPCTLPPAPAVGQVWAGLWGQAGGRGLPQVLSCTSPPPPRCWSLSSEGGRGQGKL